MSAIYDHVMAHPLFCYHDHQKSFTEFEVERSTYDYRSLLGYAVHDLVAAAGGRYDAQSVLEHVPELWPYVAHTGYGRAVQMATREILDVDFDPVNGEALTEALQVYLGERPPQEIYEDLITNKAGHAYTINDGTLFWGSPPVFTSFDYLPGFFHTFRMDGLLAINSDGPISRLEELTGQTVDSLDALVRVLGDFVGRFDNTGHLAAIKIGFAYHRNITVGEPLRSQAEAIFTRIRRSGEPLTEAEARPLADYMVHTLLKCANDLKLPVQIHTGFLSGSWQPLDDSRAMYLLPLFNRYRNVRFDVFHASWPWTSELAAIAKSYPNVWVDMCWAWSMNPTDCEHALAVYLDAVPLNKIFAYGADTRYPWCCVGYARQARLGIARTLETQIKRGRLSQTSACEIASAIMLENGIQFYRLARS